MIAIINPIMRDSQRCVPITVDWNTDLRIRPRLRPKKYQSSPRKLEYTDLNLYTKWWRWRGNSSLHNPQTQPQPSVCRHVEQAISEHKSMKWKGRSESKEVFQIKQAYLGRFRSDIPVPVRNQGPLDNTQIKEQRMTLIHSCQWCDLTDLQK